GYQLHSWENSQFTIPLADEQEEQEVTVKNTKLIDIPVTKTWEEADRQHRPESVTIELLANGDVVRTEPITGESLADEWSYTFEDLPVYNEEGKEITYTVNELDVPGYTTEIDGFNITNTQETIDIPVTKVWEDENDQDGVRENKVTV